MSFATFLALAASVAAVLGGAAAAFAWARLRRRAANLEAALRRARAEASGAEQGREAFFDLVTHELRSPLSAILGYQELLEDGAYGHFGEGADEAIERIGRSAHHLLHLIEGIVLLSRLRNRDVQLDRAPVNLGVLLSPVADAFRSHARDRGLEPVILMPPNLPTILSDQDHLVRALDLLITSAVRHPEGDSLALEIESHADGATVRVRGTELPIHPQVDPALRLGLRLAVAARIAELLGGSLSLSPPDGPIVQSLTLRIHGARLEPGKPFDGLPPVR